MYNDREYINEAARYNASLQKFSQNAQIKAVNTGGYYDVVTQGGAIYNNITSSVRGIKFIVDQWVTLEFFGGDWVIAGISAMRGGD